MKAAKEHKPQQSRVIQNKIIQKQLGDWEDIILRKGTMLYHRTQNKIAAQSIIKDGIKDVSKTTQLGRGFYLSSDPNLTEYGSICLTFKLNNDAFGQKVPIGQWENYEDDDITKYNDFIFCNDSMKQYKFQFLDENRGVSKLECMTSLADLQDFQDRTEMHKQLLNLFNNK